MPKTERLFMLLGFQLMFSVDTSNHWKNTMKINMQTAAEDMEDPMQPILKMLPLS